MINLKTFLRVKEKLTKSTQSIFSSGIFKIHENAWVVYLVSTGLLVLITAAIAMVYIHPSIRFRMKGILVKEKSIV
jgi:hypothetical protein